MREWRRAISVRLPEQDVADAAHRLDVARRFRVRLQLGPELGDVDVDGAIEGLVVGALERVQELLAGQDAPGRPREGGQQLEFVTGEGVPLAGQRHRAGVEVDVERTDAEMTGAL